MKQYLWVILTGILLALFYAGLPEINEKTALKGELGRLTGKDLILMAVITVIFAFVDFWNLGNTNSPETFADLSGRTAEISFSESVKPDTITYFSGTGTGTYYIDFSVDGVNYFTAAEITQSYGDVLKWHNFPILPADSVLSARIRAEESPFLGELVFLDGDGNAIPYTSDCPELNDETDLLVTYSTFMDSCYFDEIYHARTAWEHLHGVWPYEISHPPLGKLIIGLGISLFGMTPFGWRFSGTLFGVLMLPLLYVFIKKMLDDTLAAACGTVLLATDFLHFVQTRIATIDTYAVFFILAMYLFMYLFITTDEKRYLALSGILFGLGAASKWTCLYAGAGLAVIWLVYHIKHKEKFWKDIPFSVLFFVVIPAAIYYVSYIPYGIAKGEVPVFSAGYAATVWENQKFMFGYHSALVAEHPYSSKWYMWLLDIRPILYYLEYTDDGLRSSFGAFMNPLLCWGGLVALFVVGWDAIQNRSRSALFILAGYLAQLVPWMFVTRLTFEYHYFPCSVFLVLAMAYVFTLIKKNSKCYVYAFTALSVILFIWFYPVLSGAYVDSTTAMFKWLPTWPF